MLRWDLFHVDGRVLLSGKKNVPLRYGQSVKQKTIGLERYLARHSRDQLFLRIALEIGGERVSEDSVFFTPPRFIALPRGRTKAAIKLVDPRRAVFTFSSPVFQHRFAFELPGIVHRSSDNYFELFPREAKAI